MSKDNIITYVRSCDLKPDDSNPRKADAPRLHLLMLSLSKLGFVLPIAIQQDGLVLSGHQRLVTATKIWGNDVAVPVQIIHLKNPNRKHGINVLFNRLTNDYGALDTGSKTTASIGSIMHEAEDLPDIEENDWPVNSVKLKSITNLGNNLADLYDIKAITAAKNFIREGIQIPIVVSDNSDGTIVNGMYRLMAAKEEGIEEWPVITIPDYMGRFATKFLNSLSMDYSVNEEFADVLRYSAYRRPQNNRGDLAKAYRFWANGKKTLPDKESYTTRFWANFRKLHGRNIVDFGSGLSKVVPLLNSKGFNAVDFEPYRIDPNSDNSKPDSEYSRKKALDFLNAIADPEYVINSIFLASVLNSIPFPKDRMVALCVVHALCTENTVVYGTCRDISDFTYEYGGIRQANYFVFDSEPGVRLGDALSNPKIQKFHTKEEISIMLSKLWGDQDKFSGGNIFYWMAKNPKRINPKVLRQSLEIEFNLPYADGSTMGLSEHAIQAFSRRLNIKL